MMRLDPARPPRPGWSLVGLLVTLACMVVLFAVSMNALNRTMTGQGSVTRDSVRSFKDKLAFVALHQTLLASANDHRGRFLEPSALSGSTADDVTASLYSALIMNYQVPPEMLVSANEYSPWVGIDDDYDYRAFASGRGVSWDPAFAADLSTLSNASYAHLPLFGERSKKFWAGGLSRQTPVLGNRGPKDGIDDPASFTYGRNRSWGGHILFGDGSVEFVEAFSPPSVFHEKDGRRLPDNIFAVEDGPGGSDAILSFTRTMTPEGPVLQFD